MLSLLKRVNALPVFQHTSSKRYASRSGPSSNGIKTGFSKIIIPEKPVDLTELERQDEIIRRRRDISREQVVIKTFKPRTPGIRHLRIPQYPYLYKKGPYRPLTKAKKRCSGRNNTGKITVRGRGGGTKKRLRIVDFKRLEPGEQEVLRIESDPGRTAHIALLKNKESGNISYILACEGLRAGDVVESFRNGIPQRLIDEMGGIIDPAIVSARTRQRGNCLPLSMIATGSIIHNIGLRATQGGQLCRSAGTFGRLLQKIPEKNRAIVKLQSGEHRYVELAACATLGVVSNAAHQSFQYGKAGRRRWAGFRPKVRGVAMNKCDHPHGGGRGKSKSNVLSQSATGVLAKGYRTRRGKHQNRMKVKDRPRKIVLNSKR